MNLETKAGLGQGVSRASDNLGQLGNGEGEINSDLCFRKIMLAMAVKSRPEASEGHGQ